MVAAFIHVDDEVAVHDRWCRYGCESGYGAVSLGEFSLEAPGVTNELTTLAARPDVFLILIECGMALFG